MRILFDTFLIYLELYQNMFWFYAYFVQNCFKYFLIVIRMYKYLSFLHFIFVSIGFMQGFVAQLEIFVTESVVFIFFKQCLKSVRLENWNIEF